MLYQIKRTHVEQKGRSLALKDVEPLSAEGDYDHSIVKKPWGYEYLVFQNDSVAVWLLQIVRKRKTSLHCHPRKKTGLVLLSGKATFHHLEGTIELSPLDAVNIEEGVFHSTEASSSLPVEPHSEDGIWVIEVETPPIKSDLVRLKDEYGREGASYEGKDHLVLGANNCLKLREPVGKEIVREVLFDNIFTVRKGGFDHERELPGADALVSIIGKDVSRGADDLPLNLGEFVKFRKFQNSTRNNDLSHCTILTLEKSEKLVKLSDYVFSFISKLDVKKVFVVGGGATMHLVDSLGRNRELDYVVMRSEQAAAMAAEGYTRFSGKPGVALFTSAGGTSAIGVVYSAWVDSIPILFISGQVTTNTLSENTGLRQFGIQEARIVELVKPITKYAVTIKNETEIKYHLEKAITLTTTGRPGPVWLDIPLDLQSRLINQDELRSFKPPRIRARDKDKTLKAQVEECIRLLEAAERPVLISGNGIRLANAEKAFLHFVEKIKIPMISSWAAIDLFQSDYPFYVGRSGIMGDRAGNFAVQNADLLLILGSRMSIPQVGYDYRLFAREAKKVVVDIDESELHKPSLKADLAIESDLKIFLTEMLKALEKRKVLIEIGSWIKRCQEWKRRYPVFLDECQVSPKVNSFYFAKVLAEKLDEKTVVVTDAGTSTLSIMKVFEIKKGQRLFTSSGLASVGFGLPGAIGACFANGRRQTICVIGDGGIQVNLSELQTVVHYRLPIKLFVLNNGGYLTIKIMQQNHFGRYVASEGNSGFSCPNLLKIAEAYGIRAQRIASHRELEENIEHILTAPGPFLCEILIPENQPLIPRVSSIKKTDGTITARPLEDLFPFLSRREFLENMIVKPIEPLN